LFRNPGITSTTVNVKVVLVDLLRNREQEKRRHKTCTKQ
jgi:hypothetical protein